MSSAIEIRNLRKTYSGGVAADLYPVSNTSEIPESYLRYLVNSLREAFRLPGVPIRMKIRKGKNPFDEK